MPEESKIIITAICAQFRTARIRKSLSQQEVADSIYMSQAAYSELESGKRRIDALRLVALAELFEVPVGYFFETITERRKKRIRKNVKRSK